MNEPNRPATNVHAVMATILQTKAPSTPIPADNFDLLIERCKEHGIDYSYEHDAKEQFVVTHRATGRRWTRGDAGGTWRIMSSLLMAAEAGTLDTRVGEMMDKPSLAAGTDQPAKRLSDDQLAAVRRITASRKAD